MMVTLPVAALSQGAGNPGGWQVDLGFSSTLKYDDNFTLRDPSLGDTTIFDNKLTFGISSVTATESFSVTGSTVFRYAEFPGRTATGLEDPNIRVDYARQGVNGSVSAFARYRNVDREFLDPFQVEAEEQALLGLGLTPITDDGGTLIQKSGGLDLRTGINDPLGFSLSIRHDQRDYQNVTDPQLFDRRTTSVTAGATMKVSPVTQFRFSAGVTDYDANDTPQTDRKTYDASVGVTYDIDPALVLDASIGHTTVDTIKFGTPSSRDGTTTSLRLTKTLPNGTIYGSFGTTINQNGESKTLRFGRDLTLPLGALSASLGVTETPSGDLNTVADVTYSRQMQTDSISVSLNRAVSTNSLDQDVLNTRLRVGYGHQIDNLSRIGLTFDYGRTEKAGTAAVSTVERATLRATYTRQMTQDWGLTGGIELRKRTDSGAGTDADAHAVFLTLDRSFSFRP